MCRTLSAAWLQYHIRFFSNDQKTFSCSIHVLFILGTSLLDSYELKSPCFQGGRPTGEASPKWSSIHVGLMAFCAVFMTMVITPCSDVQMACRWMRWKLDLMRFQTMYIMNHVSSSDGTVLHPKLRLLQCNPGSWHVTLLNLGSNLCVHGVTLCVLHVTR